MAEQHKPPGSSIPEQPPVQRPRRKPEIDSDVHPQHQSGQQTLANESDNIPGDENRPILVKGKNDKAPNGDTER